MVYLKNFTILSREQEERILDSIRETCYTTRYPFNIFRYYHFFKEHEQEFT